MNTPGSTGLANQACRRCYGRKKKCDRSLPRCSSCIAANTECSFAEVGEEMGLFQVAYVRSLESRVHHLENQIRIFQNTPSPRGDLNLESSDYGTNPESEDINRDVKFSPSQEDEISHSFQSELQHSPKEISTRRSNQTGVSLENPETATTESLEAELSLLSLEAAAERYLGSSSGVSFARLTQKVLKRLKPDLQPFSFQGDARDEFYPAENIAVKPASDYPPSALNALSTAEALPEISLPDKETAYRLVEYYWQHSHTLYPFVRKVFFMESLKRMYDDPNDHVLRTSHSWMYTMWMIFAIGSTSLSSVMMTEESESIQYWKQAMAHFDDALDEGNMAALNAILLQVSYSFFNQVGPNTWYLIGMAVRIALGIGLHTKSSSKLDKLPCYVQEYRSRLFFSLYMMDRLVSVTLGRPFGIRDEDIEIEPFAAADDADILTDRILPHRSLTLPATAVPLHILALRKIAGEIFLEIYSNKNKNIDPSERDEIIRTLHGKLIEWRRSMPFPLPESHVLRVPHLSTAWYDLNYHNHVIMLYRPSPLCPVINVEKITILAEAAAMSVRSVATMHHQQKFAFNWLNLFAMFTGTLALIYAITAQPEPIASYLQRSDALDDLRLAAKLLQTFGKRFPSAMRYRDMVQEVISRLESHLLPPGANTDNPIPLELSSPDAVQNLGNNNQIPVWTGSEESPTAYPTKVTGNSAYDSLQDQAVRLQSIWATGNSRGVGSEAELLPMVEDLPIAVQLSHTPGLFDDFAAQDLVSGFDMSGDMNLDDELMLYLNTGYSRNGGTEI